MIENKEVRRCLIQKVQTRRHAIQKVQVYPQVYRLKGADPSSRTFMQ